MLLSEIVLKIESLLAGYDFIIPEKEAKSFCLRKIMNYTGGNKSPEEMKTLIDTVFRYMFEI